MKQADNGRRTKTGPETTSSFEYVWRSPWVRASAWSLLIAAIVTVLILLFPRYSFVLTVAIVGFLLAYLLHPLLVLLQRIRIPRVLGVIITYLALLGVGVLGSILIGQIFVQLGNFVQNIPEVVEEAGDTVSNVTSWFSNLLTGFQNFMAGQVGFESAAGLNETIREQVANMLASAATGMSNMLRNVLSGGSEAIVEGATSIISGATQLVFILLTSAYFLYDFPRFSRAVVRYVPVRYREVFLDVRSKTDRVVGGFLRGQIVINVFIGVTLWIGFTLLGVPLALTLAFVAALFNIVPYLGPIISSVPAVLLALTVSPWTAVGTLAIIIIANQLEAHVYAPPILGKTTNLHPVTVIISILIGVALFGIIGAFIAIPVVALAKVMFEDYLLTTPAFASSLTIEERPDAATERRRRRRRGSAG